MRAPRQHPVVVAVTTAVVLLAAVAAPVQAGPAWLSASPTTSPIPLAAGGSVEITITNTDRRSSSSPLTVTMASRPASAPFAILDDRCAGVILQPGTSCTVKVGYSGPAPTADHVAALTVTSGKPRKASVTSLVEVGVTFADVCSARGGLAGFGGTITVLGASFPVAERCDWSSVLATSVYNAAHEALSGECFDLGYSGTIGYPTTAETGRTAVGCVV